MPQNTRTDSAAYDHAAFMENFCGLEDLARDSVRVFDSLASKMLAAIEEAVAQGDARKIEVTAHTLKGAVSNFHAFATRELAGQLERIGATGDLREAIKVLAELKPALAELQAALIAVFPFERVA